MYDALIISDLHLGSEVCQAKEIQAFLKKIETKEIQTKELILNGDVFDSWDFRRIRRHHWKVLSKIRSLSGNIKITWINGNHDGPAEIVSHLLGVEVVEEYQFDSGEKKILALHGDQFDKFISEHPIITWIADYFYHVIQRIDRSFYWAKVVKKSSKTFLRCSELIEHRALEYAKKSEADVVCVGHTHLAIDRPGEIGYYNSGCWTEFPCTYLVVKDGEINVKVFSEE